MEMHQVRYFLAVAEHLNFTRAAERLHVAQPSLTRAIQKLEEELSGQLFRRERSNTHLTELGRMMLPHLQATLAAAEAAKHDAQSFRKRETGQLSVGACSMASPEVASSLLAAVSAEMAGLELHVDVAPAAVVEEGLMAGDFDAAFLTSLDHLPERFDLFLVGEEPYVLAFAQGHPFEVQAEITLEALDGEPLVVRTGDAHETALAEAMAAKGLIRIERHRASEERWLAGLVRAGMGCLIAPEAVARAQDLPYRALADLTLTHRTTLATVAGRRHSPGLAALVRQAKATRPSAQAAFEERAGCSIEN